MPRCEMNYWAHYWELIFCNRDLILELFFVIESSFLVIQSSFLRNVREISFWVIQSSFWRNVIESSFFVIESLFFVLDSSFLRVRSVIERMRSCRKNLPPPKGVFYLPCSLINIPEEKDPRRRICTRCFYGGPLPPGSWWGNMVDRNPPRGGEKVLSIKV